MNIILFGPPGSGKGTQSKFIINRYNLNYLSVGEVLRKIVLKNNNLSKIINKYLNKGNFVPNNITIKIVKDYIYNFPIINRNNFLFDGFPRNIYQAKSFNFIKINYVFEFCLSDDLIIDRLISRQIHLNSGRIYNSKYNPPKKKGLDDITGEKLVYRNDDKIDVINNRIFLYKKEIKKMRNYFFSIFKKKKQIKNYGFFKLNVDDNINNIKKKIIKILD